MCIFVVILEIFWKKFQMFDSKKSVKIAPFIHLSFHEEFWNSEDGRIFFRSKAIDLAAFEAEWVNIAGCRIFPKKLSNNWNFTLPKTYKQ